MPLMRNPLGLLLALLMASAGIALFRFGSAVASAILLALAVVCAYAAFRKEISLRAALRSANQRHGTAFKRANGFGRGNYIFFDPQHAKILLTDGKTFRLMDFALVQDWKLKWRKRISHSGNAEIFDQVSLIVQTAGPDQAALAFECESKDEGDRWHAQLASFLRPAEAASSSSAAESNA